MYVLKKVKVYNYQILLKRKIVAYVYRGTGRIWYMIDVRENRQAINDEFKSLSEAFEYYQKLYKGNAKR